MSQTCRSTPRPDAATPRLADVNERLSSGGELTVVFAHTPACRVDICRKLIVKSGLGDVSGILRMSRKHPGHGLTEPQTKVDAYAVCVHLCSFEDFDVWCDARHHSSCALAPGTVHINDMRHSWQADIRSQFHVVNFYIPQSALDAITDEERSLSCRGVAVSHKQSACGYGSYEFCPRFAPRTRKSASGQSPLCRSHFEGGRRSPDSHIRLVSAEVPGRSRRPCFLARTAREGIAPVKLVRRD